MRLGRFSFQRIDVVPHTLQFASVSVYADSGETTSTSPASSSESFGGEFVRRQHYTAHLRDRHATRGVLELKVRQNRFNQNHANLVGSSRVRPTKLAIEQHCPSSVANLIAID